MRAADCLLARYLRTPERLCALPNEDWDLLIRQARHANLLARLAHLVRKQDCMHDIPRAPQNHLRSAEILAERQVHAIHHELTKLAEAFAGTDIRPVLLKGAAYLASQQDCAQGRLFGDIDLMVPREQLALAESSLMLHGWHAGYHDEYDQRYYRQWMHEIPPLQHVKRLSIVDLHHAILPPTSRTPSPAAPLFEQAIELEDLPFSVLSSIDMVLHSATHLFHEGEFHNGLRDLTDLDSLLRHFSAQDAHFWEQLDSRAAQLNLLAPLRHALLHCQQILGTPIPAAYTPTRHKLVDPLLARALAPEHPSCNNFGTQLARGLLYIRGHWLRMPLYLLVPHLLRKSLVSHQTEQH